ncbi:MAG: hypothetical protein MRZ79_14810 [Bacteroidia bacterium]|nr:hypothetical protein [Bacteroidia bacterium]
MKNILRIGLLLLAWTVLSVPSFCQKRQSEVPGYLGKRFLTTVNIHTFPALARANRLAELKLNFRPSLHAEFVTSRSQSVYTQFSFLQTTADYSRDSVTGTAEISAKSIEVGVRLYSLQRRGNIAPMGFHHQVGLSFIPYAVKDLDGNFSPGNENLGSFRDMIILYGIGDQRIIHPSLVYYFNIQGGWLLNFFPNQSTLEATEVKALATSRLRNFSLLNISVGLGFILF